MSYARLTPSEREEIAIGRAAHRSCAEIGADLGRNASTVSRELRRGGGWSAYRAVAGQTVAVEQARTAHRRARLLEAHPALLSVVRAQLRLRWSPPQISHWLPTAHPDQLSLSAETMYRYLYALPRGALKRELTQQLRQQRATRQPKHRPADGRGQLPQWLRTEAVLALVAAVLLRWRQRVASAHRWSAAAPNPNSLSKNEQLFTGPSYPH